MSHNYFAKDGNYGSADSLLIVDCTNWTSEDWDEVWEAFDWERPEVAAKIRDRKGVARPYYKKAE